eukprot:TRINITY_DN68189_c3_g1_i1.p2 TRINITY_DN68189_c3_g1~~TRINITY_DN68189_c3_g1_i1.p2  ORF type:complete len:326 (+),score=46.66 TRINITY_DN68189_c3_g1_i1:103-978(+)
MADQIIAAAQQRNKTTSAVQETVPRLSSSRYVDQELSKVLVKDNLNPLVNCTQSDPHLQKKWDQKVAQLKREDISLYQYCIREVTPNDTIVTKKRKFGIMEGRSHAKCSVLSRFSFETENSEILMERQKADTAAKLKRAKISVSSSSSSSSQKQPQPQPTSTQPTAPAIPTIARGAGINSEGITNFPVEAQAAMMEQIAKVQKMLAGNAQTQKDTPATETSATTDSGSAAPQSPVKDQQEQQPEPTTTQNETGKGSSSPSAPQEKKTPSPPPKSDSKAEGTPPKATTPPLP